MMKAVLNQRSGNCLTLSTTPPPAMYRLYSRAFSPRRFSSGPSSSMAFFMKLSMPCSPLPGVVTPCRKYSGSTTRRAGSSQK